MKDHIAELYCSFCGKSNKEVKTLIAGPLVFICDECVDSCVHLLEDNKPKNESDKMTKHVRIENADTGNFKLVVEVWDKGYPEGEPDKLAKTVPLDYPTALFNDYLTSSRYFIVKENGFSDYEYVQKK